jgi:F-type H+-transporting ATPase subunit b
LKQIASQLRFSILWFSFVFGIPVAGIVATPYHAVAQLTSPAEQPAIQSPAEEAANPPKTEHAEAEEHENDQYRHAPVVQSVSNMLHLSVETTARMFEIINILVLALAILIPLGRFLPKFLRRRSEKLSSDIEAARKVSEDANSRLSAIEAKLSSIDQEISKFRNEVEQEMLQDEARIKAALEEESARIVASAEQEIGSAAAQAKRSLRHFAADLAIEQAAKQLVLTPETDRALIAEFVRDTTSNGAGKGGQN